jgi:hypothetical protein
MSTPATVAPATATPVAPVAHVALVAPVAPAGPGPADIMYLLQLVTDLDECQPVYLSAPKRWRYATIYCLLQTFITLISTSYVSAIDLVMVKFHVDRQVATLGQSLTIIGYALGPILLSPIS